MVKEGRRIGRPRGSGKNDTPHLTRVADLLLENPKLKPTTAMKRVIAGRTDWGTTDETLIRRWQVKWKTSGDVLLLAAKERKARQDQQPPFSFQATARALQQSDRVFPMMRFQSELPDYMRAARIPSGLDRIPRFTGELPEHMRRAKEAIDKFATLGALDKVPDWVRMSRDVSGLHRLPSFPGPVPEHVRTVMETISRIEKSGVMRTLETINAVEKSGVIQTYARLRAMGLLK